MKIVPDLPEVNMDGPNREAELVTWLNDAKTLGLAARAPFEGMILNAFLFWAGSQWQSVQSDLRTVWNRKIQFPDESTKIRIVNNRLPGLTRQTISTLTDNIPRLEAVPATMDESDIRAAKLGTAVLAWRWRADEEDRLTNDELLWLFGSGEVLRRTWFDPATGDLRGEIVNFFRYCKDPQSTESWPPRWVIESDARDVDWIKQMFGKTVEPENVADAMRFMDRLAANVVSGSEQSREKPKSSAVLNRMCVAPCEKYPQGHWFVWSGDKLLADYDLQLGLFPYSRAQWFPIPGRLYPLSFIEPLMSDQRRLNTLLSQLQGVINSQLRGDGVQIGPGEVLTTRNKETGQRVIQLKNPASRWEWMKYDFNTSEANLMIERIMGDIMDKSGQNEASLSKNPIRDVTATVWMSLKEQSFSNLIYHMRIYERHMCAISMQKLALAHEYYKTERMLNLFGTGAKSDIPSFVGADLGNTKDVITIPMPRLTPAMKITARAEAKAAGLFGPYATPGDQLAARQQLRFMGLAEDEEELAKTYGPIEDVMIEAAEFQKMADEVARMQLLLAGMQAQAQIEAMMAPPVQPMLPGGQPALPAGEQGPPTEEMEAAVMQQAAMA